MFHTYPLFPLCQLLTISVFFNFLPSSFLQRRMFPYESRVLQKVIAKSIQIKWMRNNLLYIMNHGYWTSLSNLI